MPEALAPTGEQIEIQHARLRAVIVEVGGGLRELTFDWRHILDGYAADQMADGGRGQPLIPWPNRLEDGQYEFDGRKLQVPIDNPTQKTASHGLTRTRNWSVADRAENRVRMRHVLYPHSGYPFTLDVSIEYTLSASGLIVETTAANRGTNRLPFGAGFHPYFTVGTERVNDAELRLPARQIVELDPQRMLPTGERTPVEGTPLDFREARLIGSTVMDNCLTQLERDDDGRVRVTLRNPTSGFEVAIWMDERFRYIQAFTGETLAPARRRRGIAIEPMTCPPNAFHTATDILVLEPGQTESMRWGVDVPI